MLCVVVPADAAPVYPHGYAAAPMTTRTRTALTTPVVLAILGGAYVAAQMMADIASLKIITIMGRAVDAGTLVYPFTFTLRDLVHKLAGKQVARALIFTAAAINLLMAGRISAIMACILRLSCGRWSTSFSS